MTQDRYDRGIILNPISNVPPFNVLAIGFFAGFIFLKYNLFLKTYLVCVLFVIAFYRNNLLNNKRATFSFHIKKNKYFV